MDPWRGPRGACLADETDDQIEAEIDRRVFSARVMHPTAEDVGPALDSFSRRALALDLTAAYGRRIPKRAGVGYFFPRPSAGSACKRLNLFLRWMVRRDSLDLGVWTRVSPAQLVVPLDTHVIRVGRCLRLTRLHEPRVADGAGHHGVASASRSVRPRAIRLLSLPSRDDERVRIQPRPAGCAVSAAWGVPATRA